ncbi:MAG: ribosome silencing factor [Bacteroidia bacterium]|nr:ribosome silencing factor [Bacteroidia bacterium]
MIKTILDARALSDLALYGLQDIKGQDLLRMDLRQIDGAFTDFFILCTGTSDKHVQALADSVLDCLAQAGERAVSVEGMQSAEWVLLDFGNVVVHIFQEEKRRFYRLEKLWGDALSERIEQPVQPEFQPRRRV